MHGLFVGPSTAGDEYHTRIMYSNWASAPCDDGLITQNALWGNETTLKVRCAFFGRTNTLAYKSGPFQYQINSVCSTKIGLIVPSKSHTACTLTGRFEPICYRFQLRGDLFFGDIP